MCGGPCCIYCQIIFPSTSYIYTILDLFCENGFLRAISHRYIFTCDNIYYKATSMILTWYHCFLIWCYNDVTKYPINIENLQIIDVMLYCFSTGNWWLRQGRR
jgi:hypothetical protein